MKDVKHIVVQMSTNGQGDTPESVEEILRDWLKKGFVIFYASVLNSTATTITWAYLLTKE